jgi:hypothetical protein
MNNSTKTSMALLVLLGSVSTQLAAAEETTFEICKPSSAIRHKVGDQPDYTTVRAAPAKGTCRNASSAERSEEPVLLAAATNNTQFTICKPNSAIRHRVAGTVDSDFVSKREPRGTCRHP